MMRLLRSPSALIGLVLVLAFVGIAAIGPVIWGDRAAQVSPGDLLQGRSPEHWLGTDGLGRDIFARVLVAGRLSLLLSLAATGIGTVLGVTLGALPAILPPRLGRFVISTVNSLVAFPGLLLAMFTAIVVGLGARGAVFGIGVAIAPSMARLTHRLTTTVAISDYVAAAQMLRVPRWRILSRHILPNVAEPLILNVTMVMGSALLGMAGLSFLGLGVQPPDVDWGRMLAEGLARVYVDPEVALGPAVAITAAGVGFHLLGESLARTAARESSAPAETAPTTSTTTGIPGPVVPTPTGDPAPHTRSRPGGVLDLAGLTVTFPGGAVPVRDVSLRVDAGQIVGIVGESGSGKTLTALAIGGLVPYPGTVSTTTHRLAGTDLGALTTRQRRRLLGTSLAMVFQDPMSSLNPTMKVGAQLAEVATVHQGLDRRSAWQRAVDRLTRVHIAEPQRRAGQRPHEFSGGMRQRAIIGMGLMGTPKLLIADEPTTALDVTVQRQILELLREVAESTGAGMLFISHDVAVVSQLCHRVVVMYAGRVVEELDVDDLTGAAHPYTRALVACLPDMATDRTRPLATISGRPPSATQPERGCSFAPRCPFASVRCGTERPPLQDVSERGSRVACWHPQQGPILNGSPGGSTLGGSPLVEDGRKEPAG